MVQLSNILRQRLEQLCGFLTYFTVPGGADDLWLIISTKKQYSSFLTQGHAIARLFVEVSGRLSRHTKVPDWCASIRPVQDIKLSLRHSFDNQDLPC